MWDWGTIGPGSQRKSKRKPIFVSPSFVRVCSLDHHVNHDTPCFHGHSHLEGGSGDVSVGGENLLVSSPFLCYYFISKVQFTSQLLTVPQCKHTLASSTYAGLAINGSDKSTPRATTTSPLTPNAATLAPNVGILKW